MTALRIINVIVWGALLIYMARGSWAAASGRGVRHGDPMRLACAATSIVMVGFNLRWLIAADSIVLWQMLYLLSAALAVYIWILARAYGRGPRV